MVNQVYVLFVYGATLTYGGMEWVMMNYFRHMDHDRVRIDFVVQNEKKGAFEDEILETGSVVYHLPRVGKHPVAFRKRLKQIFNSGKYQIVHAHCDAMNYRILKLAEACQIPVRISHAHNVEHVMHSHFRKPWYEFSRKHLCRYATKCLACSEEAGEWMYGMHAFEVMPNAMELERFLYDEGKRNELRSHFLVPGGGYFTGPCGPV